MNTFQSKEKRQLKKLFEYKKNYQDPYFLLRTGTKKNLQTFSRWNQLFKHKLNTAEPYSENASKDLLESDYYEYVKIIHLVGLFHQEKSYWFRDQAIHFLIKLHDKWHKIAGKLDQSFFLKIWVFESDFLDSQLVFALNKRIDRYTNMFDDPTENSVIPFLSTDTQNKVSTFDVSYQKVIEGFSQDDLNEMPSKLLLKICKGPIVKEGIVKININHPVSKNIEYFLEKEILTEIKQEEDESYYTAHIDNVWVLGRS